MAEATHRLSLWGIGGALVAAVFALWLILLPGLVATHFAWDVHPRMTQLFIGAGYIFRTAFFLTMVVEPRWTRVRWMYWGNLVFTGTLLLATYVHADEFTWGQFLPPTAHLWLALYIFEPVLMLYLVPRRDEAAHVAGGVMISSFLRGFLILATGLMLMFGLLLVINPAMAAARWPWELNALDARIMAAWFLGWATWSGTMAFATAWDEIRLGVRLFILHGALVFVALIAMLPSLNFDGRTSTLAFFVGVVGLTAGAAMFERLHERRRNAVLAGQSSEPTGAPQPGPAA